MRTRISKSADVGGSMRKFLILFTAGVLASALAVADDDPPSRAARLSYVAGKVSFQPQGEETDWVDADLNRALTTGDKLWVEDGGRSEIQTANSVVRLNGHTNFSFLDVEGDATQIQLSLGVMLIRLKSLDENETYEVDTPQTAFTLLRPGVYRIEVNEAGDTSVITVRGGDGETTADGKAAPLHVNEQVLIKTGVYDKHAAPRTDEFDDWAANRDKIADASVSVTKVAPEVVGAADLDVAGAWKPAPTYGNVWFPTTVVADWAPYRFGHWGFVPPWGWTWIDDAPWGFAPFHYGRWVMVGGLWGWAPGPIAVRAIWAPALVGFIGGVDVVGVADPVSWVALGWGEPWYPSFGVSFGYYNSVNLCGTIFAAGIIAGVWGGAAVSLGFGHDPRAVVVMGRGGFAGGHPVGREFVHGDRLRGHLDHAHADRAGARHIGATREGRLGGHEALHGRGVPPRGAQGRSAVTRHAPGAGAHGNFKGAGVNAKHGASANGGKAGAFHNAADKGGANKGADKGGANKGGSSASKGSSGANKGGSSASKGSSGANKGGSSASKGSSGANKSGSSASKGSSGANKSGSSASKGSSAANKSGSSASKSSGSSASKGSTPARSSAPAAKSGAAAPKAGGSAPKTGGSAPKAGGSAPKASGSAPKAGGSAPKAGGAGAPKAGGAGAPKAGGGAPKAAAAPRAAPKAAPAPRKK
jgi:hypothetical protein